MCTTSVQNICINIYGHPRSCICLSENPAKTMQAKAQWYVTLIVMSVCFVMMHSKPSLILLLVFLDFACVCMMVNMCEKLWTMLTQKQCLRGKKKKQQRHNASQIHHICWQVEESWLRFDSTDVNMLICLAPLDPKHTLLCSDRLNSSVKHKDCLSVCIAVLFLKEYIHVCVHFLDNYLCILCDTCKHNILIM